jgi:hypothetical protein
MESKNTSAQTFLVRNPKTGTFSIISSGGAADMELESTAPVMSVAKMS